LEKLLIIKIIIELGLLKVDLGNNKLILSPKLSTLRSLLPQS